MKKEKKRLREGKIKNTRQKKNEAQKTKNPESPRWFRCGHNENNFLRLHIR